MLTRRGACMARMGWRGRVVAGVLLGTLAGMAGCRSAPKSATEPAAGPAAGPAADTSNATGQPLPHAHIYPEVSAAQADVTAALATAKREHKRVLLDFGGDWCGDCQVLNLYFHKPENRAILEDKFVLVDVNVGRIDQNLELGSQYGVNLKKGVPALAVLDADGASLYGQSGQFSRMRHMESSSVHDFLEQWK